MSLRKKSLESRKRCSFCKHYIEVWTMKCDEINQIVDGFDYCPKFVDEDEKKEVLDGEKSAD